MKNIFLTSIGVLALFMTQTSLYADPYIVGPGGNPDPNFIVSHIMPRIDGQTPRLEAVRNPAYGTGVVAATVDGGILKVYRISNGLITTIATMSGFDVESLARTIRFDHTGLFQNLLFISVSETVDSNGGGQVSNILKVENNSLILIEQFGTEGVPSEGIDFMFDFCESSGDWQDGMLLLDRFGYPGPTYLMDLNYGFNLLIEDTVPSYRSDIDINALEFDTTSLYGNKLTMIDHDANESQESVIFQLDKISDQWQLSSLCPPVSTNQRHYRDLSFSNSGSFGKQLYVTERHSETVQAVEPDGSDTIYAEGFSEIESITISDDGEHMYVSDYNGVWHIYNKNTVTIGPEFVMREPKTDVDGVHTNPNGIDSVRLLFNEPINFANDDVVITNEASENIPLSVTGSGSQFMIVAFGQSLLNDKYTITLKDSIVSVFSGASIDGNNDGQTGGDYIFTMEHRQRHDSDNDNDIDLIDLSKIAENWLWSK